jgi:hypothetical protein
MTAKTITSVEHAKKAERLLESAQRHQRSAADSDAAGSDILAGWARMADQLMAEAQVHATLALAKKDDSE